MICAATIKGRAFVVHVEIGTQIRKPSTTLLTSMYITSAEVPTYAMNCCGS